MQVQILVWVGLIQLGFVVFSWIMSSLSLFISLFSPHSNPYTTPAPLLSHFPTLATHFQPRCANRVTNKRWQPSLSFGICHLPQAALPLFPMSMSKNIIRHQTIHFLCELLKYFTASKNVKKNPKWYTYFGKQIQVIVDASLHREATLVQSIYSSEIAARNMESGTFPAS